MLVSSYSYAETLPTRANTWRNRHSALGSLLKSNPIPAVSCCKMRKKQRLKHNVWQEKGVRPNWLVLGLCLVLFSGVIPSPGFQIPPVHQNGKGIYKMLRGRDSKKWNKLNCTPKYPGGRTHCDVWPRVVRNTRFLLWFCPRMGDIPKSQF